MDFIIVLPQTPKGKDAIMVGVDQFYKMAHFIACHKYVDVTYVTDLFLQEIVRLDGVSRTIVLNRDIKLL